MKTTGVKASGKGKRILPIFFCLLLMAGQLNKAFALSDALKIRIAGGSYSDETVIRFLAGATTGFDGSYDAWKLFSSNLAVPNIFTRLSTGEAITVNAFPSFTASVTMNVYVRIGAAGTYTITPIQLGAFAANVQIRMKDLATGVIYDMKAAGPYVISLPLIAETDAARFQVFFSYPASAQIVNTSCTSCADGIMAVTKAGENSWQYQVKDSTGATVAAGTAAANTYSITGLASRNYTVSISGNFSYTENRTFAVGTTPVTLGATFMEFTGTRGNGKVELAWSTGMESNTSHFTVERSKNGIDYEPVVDVQAAGNSSSLRNYSALDNDILQGSTYYRVKLTDLNGDISFSKIISVSIDNSLSFSVFPVPAVNDFTIAVKNANSRINIVLSDLDGKMILNREYVPSGTSGNISIIIPPGLPTGMYVLTATGNGEVTEQKIVIK